MPVDIEFVGGPKDGQAVRVPLTLAQPQVVASGGIYTLTVTARGPEYRWRAS